MIAPRTHRLAVLLPAVVTVVACAGLLAAVLLVPAPPVVLPFAVVVCVGVPLAAMAELPAARAGLRVARHARAVARLRRQLDALPETRHPVEDRRR